MCSNEKGAGRQVVHWWGGRLIGGTGMQAFTATQIDARPGRYTRAGKCTWARPHRCFFFFCARSPLCFFNRARAHLSGLTRAPPVHLYRWTLSVLLAGVPSGGILLSVSTCDITSCIGNADPAGHKLESKAVFKRYRERCVRENYKRHLRERG